MDSRALEYFIIPRNSGTGKKSSIMTFAPIITFHHFVHQSSFPQIMNDSSFIFTEADQRIINSDMLKIIFDLYVFFSSFFIVTSKSIQISDLV